MCVYIYIQTRLKITVGMFKKTKLSLLTNLHSNCKDNNGNKHVTRNSLSFSKCLVNKQMVLKHKTYNSYTALTNNNENIMSGTY